LSSLLGKNFGLSAEELIGVCAADLLEFREGNPQTDDLSMMVMRRLE